ncbi:MAG: radical SAM protein [Bacteroidia bacterium]|nr:radical SAM protein [Bacteroidia bacterium]MBT8288347.1 radical SAM protein [Bacteroidia bacterium]NNK73843.1 radical SAM protein [Flavobacteriaceae bacterium]
MNVYKLLRLNRFIKNHRLKFLVLYCLHKMNMRYLAVNLDPIMACNLRCTMCYFTDKEYVKKMKGQLKIAEVERIAKVLFKRALKLQIGCGTEPTLYKQLPQIVALGKRYKVPYISLTTNANLLTRESIIELLDAGLDEFTISLHGVRKETYQTFMQKGQYEVLMNVFKTFADLKRLRSFKVRINYTFNKDNFHELMEFFNYFDGKSFDILQIRPIRKLGNTTYNDFNLMPLAKDYPKVMDIIRQASYENRIILMAPSGLEDGAKANDSSLIFDYTFCYVSPDQVWKPEFNWRHQSFEEFSKEIGWSRTLFKNIFKSKSQLKNRTNRLNYEIEFN